MSKILNKRVKLIFGLGIIGTEILCFLLVYVGIIYFSFFYGTLPSQIPFDSYKWKTVPLYLNNNTRYRMYNDLIKKNKLIGMTKEDINNLLGPQSDPHYFINWDIRYWLGPEPGLVGIDSIWLVMKLKDNKIVKYKIVSD